MKKIFAIVGMCVCSMLAFAGSEIKIKTGATTFLKEDAIAEVIFDWKNAKWDKGQGLNEYYGATYESHIKAAEQSFLVGFNDKSKKMVAKNNDAFAKYQIKVEVLNLDKFFNMMSFVSGFTHKVWANVVVVEKASDKVVCEVVVDEFDEGRDYTEEDSLKKLFVEFGGRVARLK